MVLTSESGLGMQSIISKVIISMTSFLFSKDKISSINPTAFRSLTVVH